MKRWIDWLSLRDDVTLCREILAGDKLVYLDIGAAGGLLPRMAPFRDCLYCVTFEPQEKECSEQDFAGARKSNSEGRHYPFAVSESSSKDFLKLTKGRNESSLVEPNRTFTDIFRSADRFDVEQVLEVPTIALDSLDLPTVDVVKVDVQGALSKVIYGGRDLLARALIIEAEFELHEVYKNQLQIGSVITEFRALGFELEDFTDLIRWQRVENKFNSAAVGSLIHGDALFISNFGEELMKFTEEAQLRRLMAGLVIYRRFEMLLYLSESPMIPRALARRIKSFSTRKIAKHQRLARVLQKVARLMGPGANGYLIP